LALFFQIAYPEKLRIYYLLFNHPILRISGQWPTIGFVLALISFDWLCFFAAFIHLNSHKSLSLQA